eukprot:5530952-Amphidinium_carterae.1
MDHEGDDTCYAWDRTEQRTRRELPHKKAKVDFFEYLRHGGDPDEYVADQILSTEAQRAEK